MQELYLSKKQLPFVIVIDKMETKPKKGKNMFSKLLLTSAMKIEKNPKLPTHCLITCKTKKTNLKISSKSIRTDRKLIKTDQKLDQNWSETYVISKSFLSFLFPPKNNAFLQVIFMKSENHFGVSKKNKLESYQ